MANRFDPAKSSPTTGEQLDAVRAWAATATADVDREIEKRRASVADAQTLLLTARAPLADAQARADAARAAMAPVLANHDDAHAQCEARRAALDDEHAARDEATAVRERRRAELKALAASAPPRFGHAAVSDAHRAQDELQYMPAEDLLGHAAAREQDRREREIAALERTLPAWGRDAAPDLEAFLDLYVAQFEAPAHDLEKQLAEINAAIGKLQQRRETIAARVREAEAQLAEHDRQLLAALARSGVKLVPKEARP